MNARTRRKARRARAKQRLRALGWDGTIGDNRAALAAERELRGVDDYCVEVLPGKVRVTFFVRIGRSRARYVRCRVDSE